jgi:F-type H+-transporting ATPase subunit a
MDSPLHQFEIKVIIPIQIFGFDISITNSAVYMMLAVLMILSLFFISTAKQSVIPGRLQSLAEMSYEFVTNMLNENVGKEGKKYFPFVASVFFFILFGNLIGMIPYSFTFTSQLIVTFGLAALVFLIVTLIGFIKHGTKFLKLFMPEGAPIIMAPILIPIELISYLSRPVSLSVRLFANMMAGHTMLKVFAMFTVLLGMYGVSTVLLNSVLIGFEILVAFLQAYVFSILTCLYLSDAIHMH